ncbi:MAG: FumA C-terminus/TtdB family hydratase beta subunit [Clostridia bacterium]|nr:FumA C-terminus/TtdB family hydratase beta subunit [Clostridia bacterium]
MKEYKLTTPVSESEARGLKLGDVVYVSGHIFTSRDMAHLKYKALLESGDPLPKDFAGAAIFHAGPVCLKQPDGSWKLQLIGPTTSIRMEPYAEMVGKMGAKLIIGKGGMGDDTLAACAKYGYVYLQAAPGCAAKLAQGVKAVKDVTYFELGMPEALWDLEVENFGPLVVGMDSEGNSVYHSLKKAAIEKMEKDYPL